MIEREIGQLVKKYSEQYPVVVVHGPRQSGKTTLCKALFPDKPYYSLENPDLRQRATDDPRGFLNTIKDGAILDEIQNCPQLLSYLQQIVDENSQNGQFILTGSNNLMLMASISQSLAGRCAIFKLLPFSYSETRNLEGLQSINKRILMGSYPRLVTQNMEISFFYDNYIQTYVERDVRLLLSIKDSILFRKFIRLCAGRIGNILDISSLATDCGINVKTANDWLSILEASFIIFRLQPYYDNRNKRLIKSPKLYFYDLGIACNLLGITDENQLTRDPLYGSLFENFIITENIKKAFNSLSNASFYYYRTSNGVEIDLIKEQERTIFPVEIKSGQTFSEAFTKHIKTFCETYNDIAVNPTVVYQGSENFTYKDITISSWENYLSSH